MILQVSSTSETSSDKSSGVMKLFFAFGMTVNLPLVSRIAN